MKQRYCEEQMTLAFKDYEAGAKVSDIYLRLGISNGNYLAGRSKICGHGS